MVYELTFTLDLEQPFQCNARDDKALEDSVQTILAYLKEAKHLATVFVVGETALKFPTLIKQIAGEGHEIGFHGATHTPLPKKNPKTFEEETKKFKSEIEFILGQSIVGYRAPCFSLQTKTQWATEILPKHGFVYSSSILPVKSLQFGDANVPSTPFRWPSGLIEIPCPVIRVRKFGIPYLGGAYIRYLPLNHVKKLLEKHSENKHMLFWSYIHPYDLGEANLLQFIKEFGVIGLPLYLRRAHTIQALKAVFEGTNSRPMAERIKDVVPRII